MTIRMTFANALDSPTGDADVRLRYGMRQRDGRTVPVLTYAHGTRELTRDAWAGYQAASATITADTPRERAIVAESLALDIS